MKTIQVEQFEEATKVAKEYWETLPREKAPHEASPYAETSNLDDVFLLFCWNAHHRMKDDFVGIRKTRGNWFILESRISGQIMVKVVDRARVEGVHGVEFETNF